MADYLSVKEAAEKLDLTPAAVRALIQKGALEGAFQTPNRTWVIPADAVSAYKADRRKPAAKPAAKPKRETTKKEKEEKKRPAKEKKETKPARRRKKTSSGIDLDTVVNLILDRIGKSDEKPQSGNLLTTLLGQLAGSRSGQAVPEPNQVKALLNNLSQQNPALLQEVLQSAAVPDLAGLLEKLDLKNE